MGTAGESYDPMPSLKADAASLALWSKIPAGTRRSAATRQTLSYLRQLCVLGVDSFTAIPVAVDIARRLTGSDGGGFFWTGPDDTLQDCYCDEPSFIASGRAYYRSADSSDMTRAYRAAYGIDLATAMRRGRGWGNTARLPAFATSDEYSNVWLPARFRHGLEVTAVQSGRGWGSFVLWRGLGGRAFDEQEEALFAPLSQFLGHACRRPARGPLPGTDAPETGVVISERAGRIIYRSAASARLLQLASAQPTIFNEPSRTLPDWLRLLIGRLVRVHDDPTVRPPVAYRRNRWGDFTCRAYPLLDYDLDARSATRFAIHIEYRKPLAVQITRAAFMLGLSARQSELCVNLATGAPYVEVARRMGVRPNTVIDHVRKLYTRLNVRDRESLLGTLRSISAMEPS